MGDSDTKFPRLVSLAAHDLRTPLATIHGFAQTLVRMGDLGEPKQRYLEMIDVAAKQLAELLEELGLAARIEGGGRMADSPLKCVQSYRGIHLIIRAPLNITRGSLTQT